MYLPPVARGEISYGAWLRTTTTNLINLSTSYLWVFFFLEIYRSQRVRDAMQPLVSYGRMGLTNYILQSVIGVIIFAGFGLDWSNWGVFLSVVVGLMYTSLQIAGSHLWLIKFRYGPLEWVWRTGTYLKRQPFVR